MGKRLISSEDLILAQSFMNRALLILDSHDMHLPAIHLESAILALQTDMLAIGLEGSAASVAHFADPTHAEALTQGPIATKPI